MASGIKTLHEIDRAIQKARKTVGDAAELPRRAASALADISRKQAALYEKIADLRLDILKDGQGGALGYVDRQAVKLLDEHAQEESRLLARAEASLVAITKLEQARRTQEKQVANAVDAYDKKAEACQKKLSSDAAYLTLLQAVENQEAITHRAEAKQNLAQSEVEEKGAPYKADPYFQYLQKRKFGTKQAKGWFLTKLLDGWIARRGDYKKAAVNYRTLTDIPRRLAGHVEFLQTKEEQARQELLAAEQTALVAGGVQAMREKSLTAQSVLDTIDADIAKSEDQHQEILSLQTKASAGDSAPYQKAIELLVGTLERQDIPDLRRIAAQTKTRQDEDAIDDLIELSRHGRDLREDQKSAQALLSKYQGGLRKIETIRRQFKTHRFDAPSSTFSSGKIVSTLLGQLLAGVISSNDVWRQIKRAQRTVRRRSDVDFGGIDWTEAMRLPRDLGGMNSGGFGGNGGWGGTRRRSRNTRRRSPRINFPRGGSGGFGSSSRGSSGGGGFHTKGGF